MHSRIWPTPHPPFGHLLPQGEKALWPDGAAASLLPLRDFKAVAKPSFAPVERMKPKKVDRPQAETDEGYAACVSKGGQQ